MYQRLLDSQNELLKYEMVVDTDPFKAQSKLKNEVTLDSALTLENQRFVLMKMLNVSQLQINMLNEQLFKEKEISRLWKPEIRRYFKYLSVFFDKLLESSPRYISCKFTDAMEKLKIKLQNISYFELDNTDKEQYIEKFENQRIKDQIQIDYFINKIKQLENELSKKNEIRIKY